MHQEKYSLTWHTYSDHLKNMMKELMMNEDFSDVTLVTEDKKHIKANINILSACSPVFKDILKKEKSSNQIMYLRGIQFSEMESIIQFIYLGEATLYKERMDEFLAVAKSLEIKELTQAETNDESESEPSPSSDQVRSNDEWEDSSEISDAINIKQSQQYRRGKVEAEAGKNVELDKEPSSSDQVQAPGKLNEQSVISEDIKKQAQQQDIVGGGVETDDEPKVEPSSSDQVQSNEKFDEPFEISDNIEKQAQHQNRKLRVEKDKKLDEPSVISENMNKQSPGRREKVESVIKKYECLQCHKTFSVKGAYYYHKKTAHISAKYACNQCDYQATQKGNLDRHINKTHNIDNWKKRSMIGS